MAAIKESALHLHHINNEDALFDLEFCRAGLPSRRHSEGFISPAFRPCSASAPNDDLNLDSWYLPANYPDSELKFGSQNGAYKQHQAVYKQRAELEQNVADLQKQLKHQKAAQNALENGVDYATNSISPGYCRKTSQTIELIDEINFLEEEIANLEHHVLSLYRGLFNQCLSPSPSVSGNNRLDCPILEDDRRQKWNGQRSYDWCKDSKGTSKKKPEDQSYEDAATPRKGAVSSDAKPRHAPRLCDAIGIVQHAQVSQSQNLLRHKFKDQDTYDKSRLLDEDGPRLLKDYLSETPNQLSEDLVRCMTSIYCKLRDPPLLSCGVLDSPTSFASSSTSLSSMHGIFSDGWSPGSRTSNGHDAPLGDPFQVKGKHGRTGPYSFMVEIPWISLEKDRLNHTSRLLRHFRSMVEQLDKVDPSKLKHDEKLAFWINIYNALLMHAYLAYGIPRSNLKRVTIIQRASYKVGGRSVNASTIEHSILHCTAHRPSKWLQSLLLPGSKLKSGDERRAYSLNKVEPLVCFALCCGGRSDPAVRVYSARNVREELEFAMKEFIQASVGFHNDKKVLLPKVLEWYAREATVAPSGILDWVSQFLDARERELIRSCIHSKPNKSPSHCIEWVSYNLNFRYILDRDITTRFFFRMH